MSSPPNEAAQRIGSENVTQGNLDELASRIQGLQEAAREAKRRQARCRRGQYVAHCQLSYLAVARFLRRVTVRIFGWPWAGVLIGATVLGGLFSIVTLSWTGGLCGIALGAVVFTSLFYVPPTATFLGNTERLQLRLAGLRSERDNARVWLSQVTGQLPPIQERHRRLAELLKEKQHRETHEYRRQHLCRSNWKALRSQEFEKFLEEVFCELGYAVEMTRVTGDQGADLLVSKDGHRIAIQVKGYLHSVGNEAVQEAHFAMAYYKCEASAVITNSRFTSGAKDAADKTGCILIDEDRLPLFIMGQIDLWQLIVAARIPPLPESGQHQQIGLR